LAPMALEHARGTKMAGSTSDGSALIRAGATKEPDPQLRCPDSLARDFVDDLPVARLGDSRVGHRLGRWLTERSVPGGYWYEIARVKHFDRVLLESVTAGVAQVVILGAGLDSRAYRFADELAGVRVFEVDHPVTAERKLERVKTALGEVPAHVTYVKADLQREPLEERLGDSGFDGAASVFVLWSGVTMYLDATALDAVLTWFAGRPAGSSIAFDYDFEAFIAGDDRFHGAARTRRRVERGGERLSFGLDPARMDHFIESRGLALETNLLPDDLADRYLRDSSGKIAGRPYGFMGIVHAQVPEDSPED
jgi:methyltransferase (TIGR00027 family)